jgi:muramoyltetrapeptide carboxypeptidase
MLRIQAIAPSGKINPQKFESGRNNLQHYVDCEIRYHHDVVNGVFRGMAGEDTHRLNDLLHALTSSDIDIAWAIRGGFGATRLLPQIPTNLDIKSKLLIGYSDITAYQWILYKYYQFQSISGHMIQVDFNDTDRKSDDYAKLISLIQNDKSIFEMPDQVEFYNWKSINGPIIGGCLAVISKMMGTPYVPDLNNHILFLEDTDEPIYRIDGYFSHLFNCGVFDNISAVIFGQFSPPNGVDKVLYLNDLKTVFLEYEKMINKPIIWNFPIGHIPKIFPLPIGYTAYINRDQLEFRK